MAQNNGVQFLTRPVLNLEIQNRTERFDPQHLRSRFIRDHGNDLLEDLLRVADLAYGHWIFRLGSRFRAASRTPPVQVRRADKHGVQIWVKPGNSESAVRGVLIVTKDRKMTPEDVFKRLRDANASDVALYKDPEDGTVAHLDISLDDDDSAMLLYAIREKQNDAYEDINVFVSDIAETLGDGGNQTYWLEACEHMVTRGLLQDHRTHYALTNAGEVLYSERITHRSREVIHSEPVKPTVLVPVKAPVVLHAKVQEAEMPDKPVDISRVLLQSRDKLSTLLDLSGKVSESIKKQNSLQEDIDRITGQLDELKKLLANEKEREHNLTGNINVDALLTLLTK